MKYDVICGDDLKLLIEIINALCVDGWTPCGGISATQREYQADGYTVVEYHYYQAMTKPAEG